VADEVIRALLVLAIAIVGLGIIPAGFVLIALAVT
jgi:hypothetical protein